MNIRIIGALFFSICGAAYSQAAGGQPAQPSVIHGDARPHRVLSAQELTTERIRNMIRSEVPIETLSIPLLHRMGDGAAVEILKVMKTRGALSSNEQNNVVQMIHKAFENPRAIMQSANRTPQASLALLDQLSASTVDFGLKMRIADTKQFALDSAASAK
jgi:hypothetical protein